jgi:hypothetical protein
MVEISQENENIREARQKRTTTPNTPEIKYLAFVFKKLRIVLNIKSSLLVI